MLKTKMHFHCDYEQLLNRVQAIKPIAYSRDRNYLDGHVTELSPFITHGVISTRHLAAVALKSFSEEKSPQQIEKFLFQLAWRDFFHRVWEEQEENIFESMQSTQLDYGHIRGELPAAILTADTGISTLDHTLQQLYDTGYIHNHARMWLAFVVANLAHTDWSIGAQWMHYHLLDGDLASNTLSWQWVAGTFSKKQYIANQDNLNKYAPSEYQQRGTFLDMDYSELAALDTPEKLLPRESFEPIAIDQDAFQAIDIVDSLESDTLYVRSVYHLDPDWHAGKGQHLIFIEPKWFDKAPLSPKRLEFIQHWIAQIQRVNSKKVHCIYGYFNDFVRGLPEHIQVVYQQHNACQSWNCRGAEIENYPWLFPDLEGNYQSFFAFWKRAKKHISHSTWQELILASASGLSDVNLKACSTQYGKVASKTVLRQELEQEKSLEEDHVA